MRAVIFLLLCAGLFASCRERYGLPIERSLSNSLVVEGNILKGDSTIINLSRATAVAERNLLPETGAKVTVEGDDNTSFTLSESAPGVYKISPIDVRPSTQYRLTILTGGKEYQSEWTSLINTADIDSVFWRRNNGVDIFVSSSGSNEENRYYKWDYEEVWDFYSIWQSKAYFTYITDGAGNRTYQCIDKNENGQAFNVCVDQYGLDGGVYNDSMYHCWRHDVSQSIRIGTTAALTENVILAPVRRIENNSVELTNLYTILVKQTGLSKDAYEFYKILKGNSEGLGTIFDAQPSQLRTNFHCITDPGEIVIGYISTTTVKTKRIFIHRTELRDWHYYHDSTACVVDTVAVGEHSNYVGNGPASQQVQNALMIGLVPREILGKNQNPYRITVYSIASKDCMDCRVRGVHKKPDYWPE